MGKCKDTLDRRLCVAPMMDWTDRHCRYFHRKFTKKSLLYTEMVASAALVKGKAIHLLDFSNEEHPVALQLGGSDPSQLSEAASIGESQNWTVTGTTPLNFTVTGTPNKLADASSFQI